MLKTISMGELHFLANQFGSNWEENKRNIKIKGKSLYNFIAVKKNIEQLYAKICETLAILAEQNNGSQDLQTGGFIITDKNDQDRFNKSVNEFFREETEIEYEEIVIKEEDDLPPAILDLLFDFIRFEG